MHALRESDLELATERTGAARARLPRRPRRSKRMTPERLAEIRVLIGSWGVSVPIWATELLSALRERDEQIAKLRAALNEAAQVAMLKYEVTHKGSGPLSDYDPD